jgi:hypothetical protein
MRDRVRSGMLGWERSARETVIAQAPAAAAIVRTVGRLGRAMLYCIVKRVLPCQRQIEKVGAT